MAWWHPDTFKKQIPYLQTRKELIKAARTFFNSRDFWEVETPALQISPTMDTHIHAFKTTLKDVNLNPLQDLYLHTSPEFAMKKLLVAGLPKIYQICSVFRNGESSKLHSPEFTMLEWYRANAGYKETMEDCVDLLRTIAKNLEIKIYEYAGHAVDPFKDPLLISVAEAFEHFADIQLEDYLQNTEKFSNRIQDLSIRVAPDDRWDDLFFRVMAEKIEPYLGMDVPCILYDYPASMAALARKKPEDPRYAERFEIYICGVELANGFGELTNPEEQRTRFTADMNDKKTLYGESYPIDQEFLDALAYGLPPSSGVALGLDRLSMLATNAECIDQVLWTGKPKWVDI